MKKKVLIVNDELQFGGSDLVAVRLEQFSDKKKFDFTYCVRHSNVGPMEPELLKRGIRVIHIPDDSLSYYKSYKFILNLLKNEHFDIVHSHLLFYSGFVLMAAKKAGVPVRTAHSHFSQPITVEKGIKKMLMGIYRTIMRGVLNCNCNRMIACSEQSGEFLYGKTVFKRKGIVLNNGIDCREYAFDKKVRQEVRREFDIDSNSVVLGNIGQMWYVKNHSFLIDIFYEYHKLNSNSFLMLVSDGPLRTQLEQKVRSLNIEKNVVFTGFRNDCNRLLQAMDCFVFPSIHEGFPLTLIEAQACKLPCLVSDSVDKTTKLTSSFNFCSLSKAPEYWAKNVEELLKNQREKIDNSTLIENYDIKNITKKLEKIYLD